MEPHSKKGRTQKPTYQAEAIQHCNASHSIRCAVIGDSGIGRTTLLDNLGKSSHQDREETLFDSYDAKVTTKTGESIKISYTECPCSDEHSRLRSLAYRNSQVVFLCFSTVNRASFENAMLQWFPEINMIVPDVPVYIIGTQSDLRDEILSTGTSSVQRIVSVHEGIDLCSQMGAIQYLETAVGNLENLNVVLKQIAEAMIRQVEATSEVSGWKQLLLLSPKNSCLSPKEKHQRHVKRRKKKESVAILQPERDRTIQKNTKLSKMNFRKSALPISFEDIISHDIEQENVPPQASVKPNKEKSVSFPRKLVRQVSRITKRGK